jgi:hypothetical protein
MKRAIGLLSLAALLLTASFASAHEGSRVNAEANANIKAGLLEKFDLKFGTEGSVNTQNHSEDSDDHNNHFVLMGQVKSIAGSNIVITVNRGPHNKGNNELANKDVTIVTNSDTNFRVKGDENPALADIKVGQQIIVKGQKDGTSYVAAWVHVHAQKKHAFGEVTAVSGSSITVENNVTGATTVIPMDADTEVKINGETKTIADIQVGDRGMVKFKAVLDSFVATIVRLFR